MRQTQLWVHDLQGKTHFTFQWAEYSVKTPFYFPGYYILIVYVNRVQCDISPMCTVFTDEI